MDLNWGTPVFTVCLDSWFKLSLLWMLDGLSASEKNAELQKRATYKKHSLRWRCNASLSGPHPLPPQRNFLSLRLVSVLRLCSEQRFQKCLTSSVHTSLCGCCCCCSGGIESMVLYSVSTKTFPLFAHMESGAFLSWTPGTSGSRHSGAGGTRPFWTWHEAKLTLGWCQFCFLFLWNKVSDILSEEWYQPSLPER